MKSLIILFAFTFGLSLHAGTHFNKVLIIVFENTDFNNAMKQPYFSSLAKEGAILNNFHAITHPSQGNYVGMVAGSMLGVKNDRNVDLDARHIGNLLEEAGKSWKAYAEHYPGNCFLGATSGRYVRKHVPFISFLNVQKDPARCARIMDTPAFQKDFDQGTLADYSLYVPDLDNDGHDTGVAFGDKWLKAHFDSILHSSKMPKDLLVVITFDEGSMTPDNRIYTLLLGAGVKKGSSSAKKYDHYSILRTVEDEMVLGSLKQNDEHATIIDDVWN